MDTIKFSTFCLPVPGLLDRASALDVMGAYVDYISVDGLHPEVSEGVVEQLGQGGLQTQGVHVEWVVTRDMLHEDNLCEC